MDQVLLKFQKLLLSKTPLSPIVFVALHFLTLVVFLNIQFHQRCATPTLVLRSFRHCRHVGMLLEGLAEGFAEDAHAAAVDYADAGEAG